MMKGILRILVSTLRIKKKHFKKYQYSIDYLFNEDNEEDHTFDTSIFKGAKKLFNERRSILSREAINEIRKKLHKK